MKIHIVTDAQGNIVGTMQMGETQGVAPVGQPSPLPGQRVHEIELPKELEGVRDAEQLHQRLKAHVPR